MRRRSIAVLVTAVALSALAAGYWVANRQQEAAAERELIDFALFDAAGEEQSLSTWRGRSIVLNFWATWCAPCREEIPLLIDVQKRYAARGVQVVGVAIDRRDAVAAYAARLGMNYPVLIADERTFDILTAYGNKTGSLPFTVIIDPAGRISRRKLGAFQAAELDEAVLNAIRSPSS